MILLIDNYDSFTYNLAQYFGQLGAEVRVVRNDAIRSDEVAAIGPSHIVISPGPGTPDQAGVSLEIIQEYAPHVPILGVCLGHQAIGQAFGGQVLRAPRLMHGKVSAIQHDGRGLFRGIPSPFTATRYHSLIVGHDLPDSLEVSARTSEGEIMAIRHREFPCAGVQFHPESILTEHGHRLLQNFLDPAGVTTRDAEPGVPRSVTNLKEAIAQVMAGRDLGEDEAESAMGTIMRGEATPAQIGAFLAALRMKGETVPELTGCARVMRRNATPVRPARTDGLIDTCGTGGDGASTFNISTAAALVAAGAGQPVAKHGNRSVSSRCGSGDVLEALGVNLELTAEQIATCIDEVGIGFMFAPRLHPAMAHAAGPRRELGIRTVFNVLGPLTNPAGVTAQVLGVYEPSLTETIAQVLGRLGSQRAYVVHGAGGLDEMSTIGPNRISMLQDGRVETRTIDPAELGFGRASLEDLRGGDPADNAAVMDGILSGAIVDARRDAVVLNAAAALVVGGRAVTLAEGRERAEASLGTGAARWVLHRLVEFSRSVKGGDVRAA